MWVILPNSREHADLDLEIERFKTQGNSTNSCSIDSYTIQQEKLYTVDFPYTSFCSTNPGQESPDLDSNGTFTTNKTLSFSILEKDSIFSVNSTGTVEWAQGALGSDTLFWTNSICPDNSDFLILTVTDTPITSLSYPFNNICKSSTLGNAPSVSPPIGTFSATPAGLFLGSDGSISAAASSIGSYTVEYTPANTCFSPVSETVNIVEDDDAQISFAQSFFCIFDSTVAPSVTGTQGGIFSAPFNSNAVISDSLTGEINLDSSFAQGRGNYTIAYITQGLCPDTSTVTIDSLYNVRADFNIPDKVCVPGNGIIDAIDIKGPGNFSSANGLVHFTNLNNPSGNATFGLIDPAQSTAGSDTVTYTLSHFACTDTHSISVQVIDEISTQYSQTEYCVVNGQISITPATPNPALSFQSPVFSFSSSQSDTIIGPIPTGLNSIFGKVVWEQDNCPDNRDSTIITVNPDPGPTRFSYPGSRDICQGVSSLTPDTLYPATGTFSSAPGLALNNNTGLIQPINSDTGTYTVIFIPNNDCSAPDTVTIRILPQDIADFQWIYPANNIFCRSDSIAIPQNNSNTGGLFSVPGNSDLILLDSSNGKIDLDSSAQNQNGNPFALQFTTSGQCPDSIVQSVNIDLSTPYFEMQDTFCFSSGGTLIATDIASSGVFTVSNGLVLNGSGVNFGNNSTFVVSDIANASTPGQYWVEYQSASSLCPDIFRRYVDLIGEDSISVMYLQDTLCSQDSLSIPTITQGLSNQPYSNPLAFFDAGTQNLQIDSSTGAINPGPSTPGTYPINFITRTNTCKDTFHVTDFTIRPSVPSAFEYSNTDSLCQFPALNLNPMVSPSNVAGGSFLSIGTGLALNASGEIATQNSDTGSYQVVYQPPALSCGLPDTISVDILPTDTADFTFPNNFFCLSDTVIFPNNNGTQGGVFFSPTGSNAVVNPVNGAVDLFASLGNGQNGFEVGYRSLGICPDTLEITVDTLYNVEAYFELPASICVPDSGAIEMATNIRGPGVFSALQGIANLANTNNNAFNTTFPLVSRASTTAGIDTIRYTLNHPYCSATFEREVSINAYESVAYPNQPFFCAEGDSVHISPDSTGPNITFSASANINPNGEIHEQVLQQLPILINWAQANCPDNFGAFTLIANPDQPKPQIIYPGGPDFCLDGSIISPLPGYQPNGGTFSSPDPNISLQSTFGSISLGNSQPGNYQVFYTPLATDCSEPDTVNINLIAKDIADFSWSYNNNQTFCRWDSIAIPTLTGTTGGIFSVPAGSNLVLLDSDSGTVDLNQSLALGSNFELKYTTPGTCQDSIIKAVNIDPNTAYFDIPDSVCFSSKDILIAIGMQSPGFFQAEPGLGVINNNLSNLNGQNAVSIVDLGNTNTPKQYWISYEAPFSTCQETVTKTIHVLGEEGISINYPSLSVCKTDPPLSVSILKNGNPYSGGGSFRAEPNGLQIDTLTGEITPSGSTPQQYTVEFIVKTSACADTFRTNFQVRPSVPVTLTYPSNATYCENQGGIQSATVIPPDSGGSFFSLDPNLAMDSVGAIDVAQSGNGTFQVVYRPDSATCGLPDTTAITIRPPDDPSFSFPATHYCAFDANPSPIIQGLTGGSFSANTNLVLTSSTTGEIDLQASLANVNNGNFSITYLTNGTCPNTETDTIVLIDEDATFSIPADTCYNALADILAADVKASGTFFIFDNQSNPVDTIGNPTGNNSLLLSSTPTLGPGIFEIIYHTTGLCADTISQYLDVQGIDTVIFGYSGTQFCQQDPIQSIATGPVNTPGSFFTDSSWLSLDPNIGNFRPEFSPGGTYQIQFAYFHPSCPDTFMAIHPVTIEEPVPGFVSYANNNYLCKNNFTTMVPDSIWPLGGTFSSSNPSLALHPVTGAIDLNNSVPGTYSITYTPDLASCAQDTTIQVTIDDPSVQYSYPNDSVCTNAALFNVNFQTFHTGYFYSSAGLALDSASGQIDPAQSTPDIYQVSYVLTGTNCPDTIPAPSSIRIVAPLDPSFTYANTAYCPDVVSVSVNPPATGGGVFSSSPSGLVGAQTGTISPSANSPGNYTVYYSLSGACPSLDSVNITIREAENPNFTLPDSLCRNSFTFPDLDPNASPGTWSVFPVGELEIGAQSGIIDPTFGIPDSSYTITYTTNGPCPDSTSNSIVVVEGLTAEFTLNATNFCMTQADLVTPQLDPDASPNGTFRLDTICPTCLDTNSGAFRPSNLLPGQYTLTYSVSEGGKACEDQRSVVITIHTSDTTTSFVFSDTTVCQGGPSLQMEVTGNTLGYFGGEAGLNIDSQGKIELENASADTFTVWYYPNNAFCKDSMRAQVIILGPDNASFAFAENSYCQSDPAPTPSQLPSGNGVFFSTALSVDPSSGAVDLGSGNASSLNWIYFETTDQCPAIDSFAIEILPMPANLGYSVLPDSNICEGQQVEISTDLASYLVFEVDSQTVPEANNDIPNVFIYDGFENNDLVWVIYGNDFGCFDTIPITMDVRPFPEVSIITAPSAAESNVPFELDLVALSDSTIVFWNMATAGEVTLVEDSGTTKPLQQNELLTLVNAGTLLSEYFPATLNFIYQPLSYGCKGEQDTLQIEMTPGALPIFIPEVITPNGDGENDFWNIRWRTEADRNAYSIELYNRMGGLEYEMQPLESNWDGGLMPDGVYRWILRDNQGNSLQSGGLTIRRK